MLDIDEVETFFVRYISKWWWMGYRKTVWLNDGWEFVRRRMSRRWVSEPGGGALELPHCWNRDDAFREGVEYYRGWGSYRKTFNFDEDIGGQRCILVSEGFYGTGDVWLNGTRLGEVDGQYLGFELDVTDIIQHDESNRLGVRLTNRCGRNVLPGNSMPDFLLYGGLSGRLRLEVVPALRIDERSVKIESFVDDGGIRAQVLVDCRIIGESGNAAQSKIGGRILSANGDIAAECDGFEIQGDSVRLEFSITEPELWDVDNPVLYVLELVLNNAGVCVDSVGLRFGVRTAEFREYEGFFLNGRRVQLRGCNRHESMPGYGRALLLQQHRADAELIKDMGLNFVRLSHYPQHPEFLRACDELGILVYAEIASWKSVRSGGWLRRACRQMHDMVVRDRNHPSVILWGMGNEGRHRGAFLKLYEICKQLDPRRAVTYAENHLYRARRKGTLGIPDVWGLNYEFEALEDGCESSRMKCVVVSECSNYPHTERGDSVAESRQLSIIQEDLNKIEGKSFVAGFALWCFNDYATLRKKRYRRYSGLVDARRRPKASALWLAETFGGDVEKLKKADDK